MLKTNVDLLGQGGQSQGEFASQILANGRMDAGQMRPWVDTDGKAYISVYKGGDVSNPASYQNVPVTNGTLRRDEWKALDEVVLKISEKRLGGIQDLVDNGLVYNLGNGMGSTVFEYHDVSDALAADMTMDGVTRADNDRPVFTTNYLPIPIIHADYEINARVLAASRSLGNPLDTTLAERATRKVLEKLESMLFTNVTYTYGGGTIYSYINHPNRNAVTMSGQWDDSGRTGADIFEDVQNMKQASINDFHYGPWMLYIPTTYETKMDEDYSTAKGTDTIRERLLKIGGIKGIKVVDTLPTDNVLLVQMSSDVVRLVRGMGIQNVEWKTEGNMITKYKVMTIQVPQIRADQAGASGVIHLA